MISKEERQKRVEAILKSWKSKWPKFSDFMGFLEKSPIALRILDRRYFGHIMKPFIELWVKEGKPEISWP